MFKENIRSSSIIRREESSLVKNDEVIILKLPSFKAKPKILSGLSVPVWKATIIPVIKRRRQQESKTIVFILLSFTLSIKKSFIGENCRILFLISIMYDSNKKKELLRSFFWLNFQN